MNLDYPDIGFFLFGACLIYEGLRRLRLRRRVKALPTTSINRCREGFVEVAGCAWPCEPENMSRGLDNTIVVNSYIRVYQWGKSNWWSAAWLTLEPFFLLDASGFCKVQPERFEIKGRFSQHRWTKLPVERRLEVLRVLKNASIRPPLHPKWYSLMWFCEEFKIDAGQRLLIQGDFFEEAAKEKDTPSKEMMEFHRSLVVSHRSQPKDYKTRHQSVSAMKLRAQFLLNSLLRKPGKRRHAPPIPDKNTPEDSSQKATVPSKNAGILPYRGSLAASLHHPNIIFSGFEEELLSWLSLGIVYLAAGIAVGVWSIYLMLQ